MERGPPPLGRAIALVAAAGLAWALLCAWLALEGHAPSVTLVPIPRESYYAAQALFVVPVVLAQYAVLGSVAHAMARALGGSGQRRATFAWLGPAFALPILLVLVIPDVLVLATAGFDALAALVRVTVPLLALTTWVTATVAVRRACSLSLGRAALAALVGLIAQAALGAPLLR
jgi:hypothetical protein